MRLRLGLLLALTLAAAPAFADPTPTELQAARDLFGKAVTDEDGGRWKEALDKLKRAGSVKMTPGIRFHIALCEEKTNQLVAALADYTAAESAARAESNREVLDLVSEPLKSLRARVPTLTINVTDPNAEVAVDGKPLPAGLLGIALPVEPNQAHTIDAKATGKLPFTTQVTLKERETKALDVKLVDAPKTDPGKDPDALTNGNANNPPNGTNGTPPRKPPPKDTPPPPAPDEGSRSYAAPIAVTALAVGTLAFGFVSFFVAGGKQDDLRAACPTLTPAACDEYRPGVRTWDAFALGGFVAAGALAIVSVVLWAQPGPAPAAKVALGASLGGLDLRGSF
jgi:hypothetical protein